MKTKSILQLILINLLIFSFVNFSFAAEKEDNTKTPPKKIEQTGFAAKPAFPNIENSGSFTFEARPGETVSDVLKVMNFNNYPVKVFVYPTENEEKLNNQGNISYKTSDKEMTGVANWFEMEKEELDMEAKSDENIKFSIKVPEDAEMKDYYGALSAEVRGKAPEGGGVSVNYRFVIQANIKVTDNPKVIEKIPPTPLFTPQQLYLYGSITLFVIVVLYYLSSAIINKKKGKTSKR